MKGKKLVFLLGALILPVAIFIFLKIFGRNEFRVPALHEAGMIEAPANCNFHYSVPYRVADSVMVNLGLNRKDSLYVLYADPGLKTAMKRISVEFDGDPLSVISLSDLKDKMDLRILKECVLLMKPPSSVTLLDHHHRIRGYYEGTDRDEIDRLMVEIQIILNQY